MAGDPGRQGRQRRVGQRHARAAGLTAARLLTLQLGAERVPKALSVRGGGARLLWVPVIALLVETSVGWVLLESGLGRAALDDPATDAGYADAARAYGANPDLPGSAGAHLPPAAPPDARFTWGLDGDPLTAALGRHGVGVQDLALAALSHLHLDHTGGLPALAAAGVPVAVQRAELEFVRSGRAVAAGGYRPADWEGHRVEWRELDGDAELAPGLQALATPGHTPGHMSYRVDLPATGTWIFAIDAADLGENLLDLVPPGSVAGGTPEDERAAVASLERLAAETRRLDARLVPGHDGLMWNAIRHPPGGHC
jgi:N-acyl homoserine lactone hydrolase